MGGSAQHPHEISQMEKVTSIREEFCKHAIHAEIPIGYSGRNVKIDRISNSVIGPLF